MKLTLPGARGGKHAWKGPEQGPEQRLRRHAGSWRPTQRRPSSGIVSSVDQRIAARRRVVEQERRQRAAGELAWTLGGAALALFLILVAMSPVFNVRSVDLVGASRAGVDELVELSGADSADNLFRLDTDIVERSIEMHPWVADADVSRHLPGRVQVAVTERRPVALVESETGLALLDADGRVLEIVEEGSADASFTRVAVSGAVAETVPRPGGRWPDQRGLLGVQAVASLPPALQPNVRRLVIEGGELSAELEGGVVARFGEVDDVAEKGEALLEVYDQLASQGVEVEEINVVSPDVPTYRESGWRDELTRRRAAEAASQEAAEGAAALGQSH